MMNNYYVAILESAGFHYPFFAPGSEWYKNFRDSLSRSTRYDVFDPEKVLISIEAEVFNVDEKIINKLNKEGLARKIADRLDNGKEFNAQEELEKICEV